MTYDTTCVSHRRRQLMMPKKSPVSHMVLAHSKQHLHNKKKRPRREHRCGAGQIPSEDQVRSFHCSRMLERGKLCVPWLVRVLGILQQQSVDIFLLDQKSFPFWNLFGGIFYGILSLQESLWILLNMESKLFLYICDTWVASNFSSGSSAYTTPSVLTPSASWRRQPLSAS